MGFSAWGRRVAVCAGLACLAAGGASAASRASSEAQADAGLTAEQKARLAMLREIYHAEHPRHGDIAVPGTDSVLHLGQAYYFLDAADARRVIVEAWGNPADAAQNVLGLVIPTGKTFADSWGAVVTWNPTGWVSDTDAKSADYDALLKQMKEGEAEDNKRRAAQHLTTLQTVGWAQAPTYDPATHSAVWARELQEGDDTDPSHHGLNYHVRFLGRRGVLSLNMVSAMSQLAQTRAAAKDLAATAAFNPGARYADYKAGVDKSAGYGIAGLVAAGLGVLAVKKLGLLAVILAFGKKFIVILAAAAAGAGAWIKRQWSRLTGRPIAPAPRRRPPLDLGADSAHSFGALPAAEAEAPPAGGQASGEGRG
jgi:uncharacterized membrane-anchored protein